MALRSNRHLATLCSATALLLRGRHVDKAPGARLLIKARALHSDAHRRSRIYGRNRIPHSNLRQVLAPLHVGGQVTTAYFRVTVYANSDAISSKLVPAVIGKAEAASNAWNMIIAEELIQIKKRVGGVGALSSQCEPSSGRLLRGPDRLQRSASVAPSREEIPEPFLPASCIPRDQAPASSALPRAFFSAPVRPSPARVAKDAVLHPDTSFALPSPLHPHLRELA